MNHQSCYYYCGFTTALLNYSQDHKTSSTYTVGTYSPGKLSVVYEISIQVLPTVPSPTTTHFIGRPDDIVFAEAASNFDS